MDRVGLITLQAEVLDDVRVVAEAAAMAGIPNPFGDGKASARIADIIAH